MVGVEITWLPIIMNSLRHTIETQMSELGLYKVNSMITDLAVIPRIPSLLPSIFFWTSLGFRSLGSSSSTWPTQGTGPSSPWIVYWILFYSQSWYFISWIWVLLLEGVPGTTLVQRQVPKVLLISRVQLSLLLVCRALILTGPTIFIFSYAYLP